MYDQHLTDQEFFRTFLVLLKKNMLELIDINSKNKKGKLPLPLLKRKAEITHNVLEAIRLIINDLDYSKLEIEELGTILTQIGYNTSIANLDFDEKLYNINIDIIESFLKDAYEWKYY